jgi:hypothetical protein
MVRVRVSRLTLRSWICYCINSIASIVCLHLNAKGRVRVSVNFKVRVRVGIRALILCLHLDAKGRVRFSFNLKVRVRVRALLDVCFKVSLLALISNPISFSKSNPNP